MPLHIVRLGSPRQKNEGLRLGTVRRPPRGIKKKDYAKLNYYDLWLPELAPSEALLKRHKSGLSWPQFARQYKKEMAAPGPHHLIQLIAKLSKGTSLSVGCYCENEGTCHRSILKTLLKQSHAALRI